MAPAASLAACWSAARRRRRVRAVFAVELDALRRKGGSTAVSHPLGDTVRTIAREDIEDLLASLNLAAILPTSYVQKYADYYAANIKDVARSYARILGAAGPIEGRRVVDLGCGLAVFALVLDWAGAESVLGVDCDPCFVSAAQELARRSDRGFTIVQATVEDVLGDDSLCFDAAFSTSFLEHVYDLPGHFRAVLAGLAAHGSYVAETGVNGLHAPTVIRYRHDHRVAELGRQPVDENNPGFRERRCEIIRRALPGVDDRCAQRLARRTRGYAGEELLEAVQKRQAGSSVRRRVPWWSSNTCDPDSGYWPDRLMSPRTALREMRRAGFEAKLLPPASLAPSRLAPAPRDRAKAWFGRLAPNPTPYLVAGGFTVVGRKLDIRTGV